MKIILALTLLAIVTCSPHQKSQSHHLLKKRLQKKQPTKHCNKYAVQNNAESKIMMNYVDFSYVKCVEMTGILGHAGIINSHEGNQSYHYHYHYHIYHKSNH